MIKFLIHRPVSVFMTFLGFCILGVIAAFYLPISLLPSIGIPEITIKVTRDNTSALDIETGIVRQYREELRQIPGIIDIESESFDNHALIKIKFEYGSDIDHAFIEVNDKIDLSLSKIKGNIRRPRIIKASITDLPALYLNLNLKDTGTTVDSERQYIQLCEWAENDLARRLEQLPEVAMVDVSGLIHEEVFVELDEGKMANHGVTLEMIGRALRENDIKAGTIKIKEGDLLFDVTIGKSDLKPEDIKNLVISSHGILYRIGDFATVTVRSQATEGFYLNNGKPAICLAIIKEAGRTAVQGEENLETMIRRLEKENPGIEFTKSQDQSFLLNFSISNLRQSLIQGSFLALFILFLFISDIRSSFLTALSLPSVLLISLVFFYLFGISVNVVSLSGLILGIGMMIDNSIVVIDNIRQWQSKEWSREESVIKGTNEVIRPMITATLTSCAVFIPLIFISGIAGALFFDQAMAVVIGQGVSLAVSVTLIPTAFYLFGRYRKSAFERLLLGRFKPVNLERYYTKTYIHIYRYRRIIFFFLVVVFIGGAWAGIMMEKRLLPEMDENEARIRINWNENITLAENKKRVLEILEIIRTGLVQSNAFVGRQQFLMNRELDLAPDECEIYIKTDNPSGLNYTKEKVSEVIEQRYPGALFRNLPAVNPLTKIFSTGENTLVARLYSANDEILPPIEQCVRIKRQLQDNLPCCRIDEIPVQKKIVIKLDPLKAKIYHVSFESAYSELKVLFGGYDLAELPVGSRFISVVAGSDQHSVYDVINRSFITTMHGEQVPVRAVMTVTEENTYETVYGGKEGIYVPLNISTSDKRPADIMKAVNEVIKTEQGILVSYSGSHFDHARRIKEMITVLIISVFLLYFILAAQFESMATPVVVLLEIPIDLAFAIILLYFSGNSINIMSMIGFIVMGGIIINDSILKIDMINQLRWSGMDLEKAIHEGGRRRIRPILMTALTTGIALIPQMFGSDIGAQLQKPMSIVILAGLILGTIVSLFLIPILYRNLIVAGIRIKSVFQRSDDKGQT